MKRKILISQPAQEDIREIVRYIRLDKPIAAERFKALLGKKIQSLTMFSERGRMVPELKGTPFEGYRELIISPCRLIYKLTPREIRILRVLHSRREFELF